MSRDGDVISGAKFDRARLVVVLNRGVPFQDHHPLVLVLIVPKAFGAALSGRDNAFDANRGVIGENGNKLFGYPCRHIVEQVLHVSQMAKPDWCEEWGRPRARADRAKSVYSTPLRTTIVD